MNKHLLTNAIDEIESLRRQNEILSAQVGVVEVFAAALGLRNGNRGATPDVVWALRQEIAKVESAGPHPEQPKEGEA